MRFGVGYAVYWLLKEGGWSVFLGGSTTSRMTETIRIALALEKEGSPVEIHDAEELRPFHSY
ncbi:MAG: hypothetical protein PVG70_05460 [Desulfobacterales bacterium]